ncbi:MAG: HEAT repeat domain-containing protein, partial [Planctomycetota bacterium JB042]
MHLEIRNLGAVLTAALLATSIGCATNERGAGLPPALETQMNEAVTRVKHTRGVDKLGNLRMLSAFGSHATEKVEVELLASDDPLLRSNAVFVLGEIYRLEGDPNALEAIRRVRSDENRAVRLEAARALLDGGDTSGLSELFDGLEANDRPTRIHSFLALRRASGGRNFGYDPDADPA